jgi:hypothetical protein
MKTATFVKRKDTNGEGAVYRLDPPMPFGDEGAVATFVWVHAIAAAFDTMRAETYIFACDENGEPRRPMLELPGSYRGGMDQVEALRRAGYTVRS